MLYVNCISIKNIYTHKFLIVSNCPSFHCISLNFEVPANETMVSLCRLTPKNISRILKKKKFTSYYFLYIYLFFAKRNSILFLN